MDKIVQQVIAKFNERSAVGIKKYGTTLADNNNDDYLTHLQEELMDAVLYIEKLKTQREEVATNCSQPGANFNYNELVDLLIGLQIYMCNEKLINEYDWDYRVVAKKYLNKITQ